MIQIVLQWKCFCSCMSWFSYTIFWKNFSNNERLPDDFPIKFRMHSRKNPDFFIKTTTWEEFFRKMVWKSFRTGSRFKPESIRLSENVCSKPVPVKKPKKKKWNLKKAYHQKTSVPVFRQSTVTEKDVPPLPTRPIWKNEPKNSSLVYYFRLHSMQFLVTKL